MLLKASKPARKKRGFILVVALFFLMLLAFIGTALIGLLPLEFRSSSRNQLDVQAHYAAAAGIRYASDWFTAVISRHETSTPAHWIIADKDGSGPAAWGNAVFTGGADIMSVPSTNDDWELLKLDQLKFPKTGYSYIPPVHNGNFAQTGNLLCGYNGADAPNASSTYVVATKRPLKVGSGDWEVWVAFVPHNDQDTPGSQAGGANNNVISNSRAYQMVSIAVYQGQPYLRAKAMVREATTAKFARLIGTIAGPDDSADTTFNISGAQFEIGAASANKVLYEGPVHSNSYLPLSIQPAVWNSTNGAQPFQGVLSYSQPFALSGGWNQDDVRWSMGNYGAFNADRRPFAGMDDPTAVAATAGTRYDALIRNGKANLQQTKTVAFPPDTNNLYDAAFGRNGSTVLTDVSGAYTDKAVLPAVLNGAFGDIYDGAGVRRVDGAGNKIKPQGLFVNYGTGGALGGVYVNGDVKAMMLEVTDSSGLPQTSPSTLATASQNTFNSGIRVQEEKLSSRPVTVTDVVTNMATSISTNIATVTNSGTNRTTSTTKTTSTSLVTGTTTTTNTVPVGTTTSFTTSTTTNKTTNGVGTSSTYATSTTFVTCTTKTTTFTTATNVTTNKPVTTNRSTATTSQLVSDADGSGNSHYVRTTTVTTSFTTTTNFSTNKTTSSNVVPVSTAVCGTNRSTSTNKTTSFSTSTTTNKTTNNTPTTSFTTNKTTNNGTSSVKSTSTTKSTATTTGLVTATTSNQTTSLQPVTSTQATVLAETWNAIDRALFPGASGGLNISPTMSLAATQYLKSPAGQNSSFQFDTAKATQMKVIDGLTGTALSGTTNISTNSIVVLKQSRTDPNEVFLFVVPKNTDPKNKDGTNGSVFVDGSINGLGGANLGKRTLAVRNDASGQKDISIADNIIQVGTAMGAKPATSANGLGIIANDVNIVANNDNYGDLTTNPLQIYGIILAGKSNTDGGLRIKRSVDALPPYYTSSQISATQRYMTPAQVTKFNDPSVYEADGITLKTFGIGLVNDAHLGFDMNYLLGSYRNWKSTTPFFKLYGGLLERQPRIIYNGGATAAGWRSSFSYDQELANNPPPFWPTTGQPEIVSYQEERL